MGGEQKDQQEQANKIAQQQMMLSSRQQRADRRQNSRIAKQTNRIAAQDRSTERAAIDAQNNLAAAMQDSQSLPTEFIDETGKKRRGMGGMQSAYGFAPMGGSGSGLGGPRTTLG